MIQAEKIYVPVSTDVRYTAKLCSSPGLLTKTCLDDIINVLLPRLLSQTVQQDIWKDLPKEHVSAMDVNSLLLMPNAFGFPHL